MLLHLVLPQIVLGGFFVGFLIVFWATPWGVPALERRGGGRTPPDLSFGYRADETYRLLDLYGRAGVAHWRRLLLLDLIFPAVYATLFASLAADWGAWAHASPGWRIVAIGAPILAGVCDYVENFLLLAVLAALPRKAPHLIAGASAFTRAKFVLAHATLAIPLLHWAIAHLFSTH